MRFSADLLLTLLASSLALAAPGPLEERFPRKPPGTRTQCYTSVQSTGTPPASLSTKYYTHFKTCTSTVQQVVTKTTSKRGKYTQTITNTATVSAVTTVGTPEGFSPVETTLPDSTYTPEDFTPANPNLAAVQERGVGAGRISSKKHPVEVVCYAFVDKCGHTTTTKSTTTVAPSTVPTIKTTTTVTSTSYTSSVYAACATNNFANRVDGYPIDGIQFGRSRRSQQITGVFEYLNAPSAYNCCSSAIQFPAELAGSTAVWLWEAYYGSSPATSICEIILQSSCTTPEEKDFSVSVYDDTDDPSQIVVGNAQCGVYVPTPTASSSSAVIRSTSATPGASQSVTP